MAAPAPASSTDSGPSQARSGAYAALILLLVINLFNYIDRQILSAVLPLLELDACLFNPADPLLEFKLGLLTSAFLVSYTIFSPIFGWLGDRGRRWLIVGVGVTIWSVASGASGLATAFLIMLLTRCLVGIGEAAYGPVAPSMISDLFPIRMRGKVISCFYLAIPVGSALGFVIGGQIAEHFGWREAFLVTLLGLIPAFICFLMKEPPRPVSANTVAHPSYISVLKELPKIRSFVLCCAGMTMTTFMLGGVAAWAPKYIFQREARFEITDKAIEDMAKLKTGVDDSFVTKKLQNWGLLKPGNSEAVVPPEVLKKLESLSGSGVKSYAEIKAELLKTLGEADLQQYGERIYRGVTRSDSTSLGTVNLIFGVIIVISGLGATLLGGWFGDWLRSRGVSGAYFHASGWTTVLGFPFFVAVLYTSMPVSWVMLFIAVFFLFFNTGPANTVLANVTRSEIRATAFAINILVIHMLGDVISPPIIGYIAGVSSLHTAFLIVSISIPIGGILWVLGAKHLDEDTRKAA
jgi:MFS transporter, Spinster family, sphingosine-1-phosphate transporter